MGAFLFDKQTTVSHTANRYRYWAWEEVAVYNYLIFTNNSFTYNY